MKRSVFFITIITIIVFLSIVQTVLSNILSTSGVLMSKINREIQTYKTENAKIREKLFLQASLTNIASKAAELGFVESKSEFVLKTSMPLAVRQ